MNRHTFTFSKVSRILTVLLIAFNVVRVYAQEIEKTLPKDSFQTKQDTVKDFISNDAIEAAIVYTAVDSIPIDFENNVITLYGKAVVTYQNIKLEAGKIVFDWKNNIVTAEGIPDSLGNISQLPVFFENEQEYRAKKIVYNFKTKKGKLYELFTSEGEGFIHGEEVKKDVNNVLYAKNAKYTTCGDPDHPHFYIRTTKIKILDKKIISGPAWMVIEDIPLPFIVPFGFFPKKENRSSGILMPSYGESSNRGFYLKGGGYYFALSDYFDLALKGDIYSRGSWLISGGTNYNIRYKFNGNLFVQYANNRFGDPDASDFYVSKDFNINWTHNQDSKARPNSSFRANVNAGSQNSFRNNSTNPGDVLQNTLRSSISYSYRFAGTPFSLNTSIGHSQNLANQTVSITAPDIGFNMNRITPFKSKNSIKKKWYNDVGVRYTLLFRNNLNTIDTLLFDPQVWKKWENGMQHSLPISTNFKVLKYFNVSPSINYTGFTYFKTIEKTYYQDYNHTERDTIITKEQNGLFHANDISASASVSSRIYGMLNVNKFGLIAIRHVITPSASMVFKPDFSDPKYGYYKKVQKDSTGNNFETYSVVSKPFFGMPGRGQSASLGFSIQNNIEAKMVNKDDTVNTTKKVTILDNFNMYGNYNFLADSMKLSILSFNGRTSLFKNKLNLQFGFNLDPYYLTPDSHRVNRFEWKENSIPGRVTNGNLTLSTNLNSNARKKGNQDKPDENKGVNPLPYDNYVDFNIPWNVNIGYSLIYSKPYFDSKVTQTLNFNGNLSLTQKWKLSFNSGYDLEAKELTYTSINIHRDLHCWEMSFSWVPFGYTQNYLFRINVKSSVLKDLKLDKKKSYYDY